MVKALLIVSLLLQPFVGFGADNPYSDDAWLREGLARQISQFKRVTLTPHPGYKGIVVANCEKDLAWWGRPIVFHHTGDKVDWIASFPAAYTEQAGHYVLSCNWRYLEKLQLWILEIFDSTHMGNGSLWLFTLKGRDLRPLLHTTARGRFLKPPPDLDIPALGETRLHQEHLTADYRVPTGAKEDAEAVFLTGTIVAFDAEGKEHSTRPFKETWTWNSEERVFTQSKQ